MAARFRKLTLTWIVLLLGACGERVAENGPGPLVAMETGQGRIVLELDPRRAPVTVGNFLRYVDEGRYNGASFYRAVTEDHAPRNGVRIQVIQGGFGYGDSPRRLPAIALERTRDTGLRHTDGTLSMARVGPDSATSEFFICIGDHPELDYGGRRYRDGQGFAAFGRVVEGMDVVKRIQQQPAERQMLIEPVEIKAVSRLDAG